MLIEKIFRVGKKDLLKLIIDSVIIFFAAAVIGFFINMFHPAGYTFVSTETLNEKKIVMISSDEAVIKRGAGAVIIDTRTTPEFNDSRISGALHLPSSPDSVREKMIKEKFDVLQGPREIVLYCDGASCGSSSILAKRLLEMGYSRHVYIIEGGIPEWRAKGLPLEKTEGAGK